MKDDRGVTLVETLVAMILIAVVGTIVLRAVIDSNKLVRITNDQSQGLADVRVATERLSRDVRNARSVLCNPTGTPSALLADTACAYHLQLWVDYNSDYVQQTSETVTWNLRTGASAGQYDLVRTVQGGAEVVEARTIVQNVAFTYDLAPGSTAPAPGAAHTSEVNVNMFYDAQVSGGTSTKTVSVTARLRNVS
jgi:prepilin-type N-terminal cleavage/methylation domain-containing protein